MNDRTNIMKPTGFTTRLLACLLLLCARPYGTVHAQQSIDIGAEVWIEPGQTPEQIDRWFRLAADNGMYSVRLFLMWNYIEARPGTFDFSLYDAAFAAANRHGVRIEATLCAIHGPAWLSEKFRGRPQFNELFASEEVLVRATEYIRQTVTRYRGDRALESWWVLNEPRRFDPDPRWPRPGCNSGLPLNTAPSKRSIKRGSNTTPISGRSPTTRCGNQATTSTGRCRL